MRLVDDLDGDRAYLNPIGQLFAADVRTAARHHHGRVPAQQGDGAPESVDALELLFKLLIRWG